MYKTGALYIFELKKILMRKIVWITLGIMIALNIWIPFADLSSLGYEINGEDYTGYELLTVDRAAARKLSGKAIDNALLNRMRKAYLSRDRDTPSGTAYDIDRSTGIESSVISADSTEPAERKLKENEIDIENIRK